VLFCDLDGFKRANDEHGHAVGDLLLVEVAKRLRAVTGMQDLVARVGGDELVILCRGAGQERLDRLVRRVEDEVGRPIETERGAVRLGVSVGTALGVAGDDPDELVRVADRRMYRVKSRRRIA
jgi:diguanylate cyclase (GGDEF)-like protein